MGNNTKTCHRPPWDGEGHVTLARWDVTGGEIALFSTPLYETLHFSSSNLTTLFCVFCVNLSSLTCCLLSVMPSKATLFNCNCEPIYDFGTGHRNVANFNPQGNNILNNCICVHVHTRPWWLPWICFFFTSSWLSY